MTLGQQQIIAFVGNKDGVILDSSVLTLFPLCLELK